MTATEELRRLLDERGVEWEGREDVHTDFTFWCGVHACEMGPKPSLAVYHLTPEQAIAATLGAGTCKRVMDSTDPFGMWVCDHCGHPLDTSENFCGGCGRKVVADG